MLEFLVNVEGIIDTCGHGFKVGLVRRVIGFSLTFSVGLGVGME